MITAGELRKGVTFEYEGKIYVVVDCGSIEGKIDSTDKYQIKTIRSDKLSENLSLLNSFSEVGTLALWKNYFVF